MIRVIAHTSEPLLALALNHLFGPLPDATLCAVADNPEDLRRVVTEHQPDVALISMVRGIDWGYLSTLRKASPRTYIVLWAEEIAGELAHQALECGVRGILRRSLPPEMLLKCVRKVSEGELWFEKSLTASFLSGRSVKLSRREGQLVKLLAQGLKNKEIAAALSICEGTVKVYLSKLYVKIGARDRFELALYGLRNMNASSLEDNNTQLRTLFVLSEPAAPPEQPAPRSLRARA